MKRLIPVLAVVASLAALPFSHLVLAGPGNGGGKEKVKLCHITGQPAQPCVVDRVGNPSGNCLVGHVIEVGAPAVEAHCNHGDHLNINPAFEKGDDCERPVEWTVDANCDATP
ncbi:MAG: hypothetical protein WD049_05100 [Candidatus Paceibacterota bacterium]